jgi:hypothetical protein
MIYSAVPLVLCYSSLLGFMLFLWYESPNNPKNAQGDAACTICSRMQAHDVTYREFLRCALRAAGFFESFTFVCLFAVFLEGVAFMRWDKYRGEIHWQMWRLLVAYVASNHFLYFVHTACDSNALGRACPTGIGSWMVESKTWVVHVVLFGEHRLADVVVHAGMCMSLPFHVAALHWYSLTSHLLRYGGMPGIATNKVRAFRGFLSVDDIADCLAHTLSGARLLGFEKFVVAVFLWEAIRRWIFGRPLRIHHLPKCSSDGTGFTRTR